MVVLPVKYYIDSDNLNCTNYGGAPKAQICMNNTQGDLMRITTIATREGISLCMIPLESDYIIIDDTKIEGKDYNIPESTREIAGGIEEMLKNYAGGSD